MDSFPLIRPNFINFIPIDWKGYESTLNQRDLITQPQQWYPNSLNFLFSYQNICKQNLDELISFYNQRVLTTPRSFLIPETIFRFLPKDLKRLTFCQSFAFCFASVPEISPVIVNKYNSVSNLSFRVRSVIS